MAPLDPIQIAELIQILPATEGTPDFTGVDGRNAPESTLRQPSDRIVAEAAEMVQKTSAQLESPNVNTLQARQRGCWDVLCLTGDFCDSIGCQVCVGWVIGNCV